MTELTLLVQEQSDLLQATKDYIDQSADEIMTVLVKDENYSFSSLNEYYKFLLPIVQQLYDNS